MFSLSNFSLVLGHVSLSIDNYFCIWNRGKQDTAQSFNMEKATYWWPVFENFRFGKGNLQVYSREQLNEKCCKLKLIGEPFKRHMEIFTWFCFWSCTQNLPRYVCLISPDFCTYIYIEFPLKPMGVLAPGSVQAWPSAQPPIDTSGIFPSNISLNPSEVIAIFSEP